MNENVSAGSGALQQHGGPRGKPKEEEGGGAGDYGEDGRYEEEAGDVPLLWQLARLHVVVADGNQSACKCAVSGRCGGCGTAALHEALQGKRLSGEERTVV